MLLTQRFDLTKTLTLRDRLVMPPIATEKADDGAVTDALCAHYAEKAAGGYFGLIVLEHAYVDKEGQATKRQLSFADDRDVAGLARIVDTVHAADTPLIAQINHAGGKAIIGMEGQEGLALAPSAQAYTSTRGEAVQARSMTLDEIDGVVESFAAAARRAKEAGFDGVEIHSAHGYLLSQFYSPVTNRRNDAYCGTSIEGRTQLHRRIIAAVRGEVGEAFPLLMRLGACDYCEGGATVEDAVAACALFKDAGVDAIDVSGGLCGYRGVGSREPGYFGRESKAIKEQVGIPVIVTGGVREPQQAEWVLQEGLADLVGVGRATLKDSSWSRRAIVGA